MTLKRRDFLKSIGLATAALGLWDTGWSLLGDRYGQALAQPARRKLALLVGLDRYGSAARDCPPLRGCLMDLELQRQTLIYRYGFQPEDIVTLTDQAATRSAIETTFLEHLVQQARPDDVVVFHFSGYGSQIQGAEPDDLQPSLVAADSALPRSPRDQVNDLPLATLGLLLRALDCDRVITVLDTSHAIPPQTTPPLAVRWRSRLPSAQGDWNPDIVAVQDALRQRALRPQVPGLYLQGSDPHTPALELDLESFAVGAFTASLTQQLWQELPNNPLTVTWQRALSRLINVTGISQHPTLDGETSNRPSLGSWGLVPMSSQGVDGSITRVDSNGEVRLWFGGMSPTALKTLGYNSQFTVVTGEETGSVQPDSPSDPDRSPLSLKVQWRDRLTAAAYLTQGYPENLAQLAPGQGIQEKVRWLPRSPQLTIGLEPQLDRIERIDATSAFAAMGQVEAITMGDRAVDYVFGRLQALQSQSLNTNPDGSLSVSIHRYGLCAPGQEVLPGTISSADEAVKTAVQRLGSRFRSLLALKLLRSLINTDSTRVPLKLEFKDLTLDLPLARYVAERAVGLSPWYSWRNGSSALHFPLPQSHTLRYQCQNLGNQPLYGLLIATRPDGSFALGYPPSLNTAAQQPAKSWVFPPFSATIAIDYPSSLDWVVTTPTTAMELFCVVSTAPFPRTLQVLAPSWEDTFKPLRPVANPLGAIESLLEDLYQGSRGVLPPADAGDTVPLEVSQWAVVRLTGQVQG